MRVSSKVQPSSSATILEMAMSPIDGQLAEIKDKIASYKTNFK